MSALVQTSSSETKQRVAVFGSSVNPPTGDWGHRGIILTLISTGLFDEILINPVYRHMFAEKRGLLSFEHRYRMSELNFLDTGLSSSIRTQVVVSDVERTCVEGRIHEGESCGTNDILNYLRDKNPNKQFDLILGFDGFKDLIAGKWKNWENIIATTHLHVFKRGEEFDSSLYEGIHVSFYEIKGIEGTEGVSSTLIREKITYVYKNGLQNEVLKKLNGEKVPELDSHEISVLFDSNHINPKVLNYIFANYLFVPVC